MPVSQFLGETGNPSKSIGHRQVVPELLLPVASVTLERLQLLFEPPQGVDGIALCLPTFPISLRVQDRPAKPRLDASTHSLAEIRMLI